MDADGAPLFSKTYQKPMNRDIVQFVPFNKYANNPAELAKQTLAEIPKQMVDFMTKAQVKPFPKNEIPQNPPQFMFYNEQRQIFANKIVQKGIDPNLVNYFN